MAILMMGIQMSASKSLDRKIRYVGQGMALCHSEYTPGQDGWLTVEFTKFESSTPNTLMFTLQDGTTVEGNFPCVVNFDRRND